MAGAVWLDLDGVRVWVPLCSEHVRLDVPGMLRVIQVEREVPVGSGPLIRWEDVMRERVGV